LSVLDRRAPSLDEIETLAREAFSGLPDEFRRFTGDVVFVVQDFPDDDVVEEMDLDSPYEILGLFQGPDLADRQSGYPDTTMIFLYRRPIIDYWAETNEPLDHIVRHVLVHEIGHHFGLSDEQMEAIEEREGD
jgi:predicted Zn-dependent protease with MMP-like domain